jgi:hypothetical protein
MELHRLSSVLILKRFACGRVSSPDGRARDASTDVAVAVAVAVEASNSVSREKIDASPHGD